MKRYGAYRGKDALRRKFEGLKQDKGEKPEDYLDRLVNERMRGWPEESVNQRDSESISKFIHSIHERKLAWRLHDRVEWHQANGKLLTLEDFRELLMDHLTGVETFEYERAGVDSLDERMQAKLPSYGTPLAAAAVEVREPIPTTPVGNSSNFQR